MLNPHWWRRGKSAIIFEMKQHCKHCASTFIDSTQFLMHTLAFLHFERKMLLNIKLDNRIVTCNIDGQPFLSALSHSIVLLECSFNKMVFSRFFFFFDSIIIIMYYECESFMAQFTRNRF